MTTDTVLSLADRQAPLETAGGKGASLARLSAAGLFDIDASYPYWSGAVAMLVGFVVKLVTTSRMRNQS